MVLATLAVTLAYAVLRYNVIKGVAWAHLPLYVANKSVAWSSVVLFALAAARGLRTHTSWTADPRFAAGAMLAGAHVWMSLALLGPADFPELYDDVQRFTLEAELAMLVGVIGAALITSLRREARATRWLPIAMLAHPTLLGFRSWATPSAWPGYLLPITLLSAITALVMAYFVAASTPREPRE